MLNCLSFYFVKTQPTKQVTLLALNTSFLMQLMLKVYVTALANYSYTSYSAAFLVLKIVFIASMWL